MIGSGKNGILVKPNDEITLAKVILIHKKMKAAGKNGICWNEYVNLIAVGNMAKQNEQIYAA